MIWTLPDPILTTPVPGPDLPPGAPDAQYAFGDLDVHRPALLAVHDAVEDGIAARAAGCELVARRMVNRRSSCR
ncbi:hypothetical protein [Streptomyces pseudogriseolus]|uniref:hypothetical protein n=1 Tax=Streptomyces pseudogriseolus TaxID=36817 RepID=UPI003FA26AD5